MRIVTFHMDQLGDLIFSLPALHSLRKSHPEALIVSVVRPSLSELLESTKLVDRVLPREREWKHKIRLLSAVLQERFDVAVCFSQTRESVLVPWAAQVPHRVGYEGSHFEELLTDRLPLSGPVSSASNLTLVEQLGCVVTKQDYVGLLPVTEKHRAEARRLLLEAGWDEVKRLVIIAPGSSKRTGIKQWTEEGFAGVADRLSESMCVVLVGVESADGIKGRVSCPVIDLTRQTSLPQLAGVLAHAELFVGIDSGVMHLAASLDVPVVALFGPTDPQVTGPCGEKHRIVRNDWWCSPCHLKVCPYRHECLDEIDSSAVWTAIEATGVI